MNKIIVAIGGGENGRRLDNNTYAPYETENIDVEIIKLTNKNNPNFLFLGHAMYNSIEIQESYFQTMKKIYGEKFGCNCRILKSTDLNDSHKVKEYIDWADIIYEGGGDTYGLIKLWLDTGFDKELFNAWQMGKVISGVSAGAVCWFRSSNSLSDDNRFNIVNCLDWINLHITPHGDEQERSEATKYQLKENELNGIILSNCSALVINNDEYKFVFSNNVAFAKKVYWKNNDYFEEECVNTDFLNIDNLIK